HGEAVLVGSGDDLVVADRATGLDDGHDPRGSGGIWTVPEREEGVAGEHRPTVAIPRALDREPDAVDAAHLPGTDAHQLPVLGEDDGVGLRVLAGEPG